MDPESEETIPQEPIKPQLTAIELLDLLQVLEKHPELANLLAAWPKLSDELRWAVLRIARP